MRALPVIVAALVRALAFPFAEDLWGDAPVRLELVRRWVEAPALFWSYRDVFQFGPLPTHLAGPLALIAGPWWGPRLLVFAGGVAAAWLAARVGRRLGGESVGLAAGLAVALSPLLIQASVTFASEALYLAFALGCLDRLLARDLLGLSLCAFAASTTRWDAWLWLPMVGLWLVVRARPEQRLETLVKASALALGPLSILAANAFNGDALAPLRHVSEEHVRLAAQAQAQYGVLPWRLAMLFWWPMALLLVLTPGFGLWTLYSLVDGARRRLDEWISPKAGVAGLGLLAPALYAFRSVFLGTFWPMTRFATGPAAFLVVAMKAPTRRILVTCTLVALAFDVLLVVAPALGPKAARWASPLTPVPRLTDELRGGVGWLEDARCQRVLVGDTPYYEDILLAHHAGCDRFALRREKQPQHALTIDGSELALSLERGEPVHGFRCVAVDRIGRLGWWRCQAPR